MKIKYLGTGAAEGIPALFCHCDICNYARKMKGKNIRTRAQLLIDNELLIDFGPDTLMHSIQYDIELANILYCLITHTHDDHLYVDDLRARRRSRANLLPNTPPLNIYGGQGVYKALSPSEEGFVTKDKSVLFRLLDPYREYQIGKYNVIPLPAEHNSESPYVYIIQKNNISILYAHDTDYFNEETWKYIQEKKIKFSLVSLDCTEGKKHIDYPGHMNFERMEIVKNKLKEIEVIDEKTQIIANHISHNGLVNYDEAVRIGNKLGFIISYDGMEINL